MSCMPMIYKACIKPYTSHRELIQDHRGHNAYHSPACRGMFIVASVVFISTYQNMSSVPITKHGAELLKEELARLKTKDRPAVINAISEARAQGDLSENAEYDA